MRWAKAIREFFSILFGSQLVVQLRQDLDEAKRERDYFRGQLERANLLIAPPRTISSARPDWRVTNPEGQTRVGTRRTWAQIQAENTQKIKEEAAKANQEKPQ